MTDKALEAAARAVYDALPNYGMVREPNTAGGYDLVRVNDDWEQARDRHADCIAQAQAAISAYLDALPGEAEVVGLVERLNRWRSETVNQWSDEYEPRTSWEKQVSDAMKEWHEASTQVSSALQAMQARAKKAEEANKALMRERTSLIETKREQIERLTKERDEARRGEYAANEYEPTWYELTSEWKARAETAEQEAKALLDALNQVGLTPEQKSWIESFLKTRAFLYARQALEAHHEQ